MSDINNDGGACKAGEIPNESSSNCSSAKIV